MPTDLEKKQVVAASLIRQHKDDNKLGSILAAGVCELLGPEPKRITKEHFDLIVAQPAKSEKPE